jgi:pimeloyl-ACP methyl ester carboxylesterase
MTDGNFRAEDGCLLAYEDVGEGMPVLWQHGLGADRNQPAEVFPALPGTIAGVRRLTLECRGHGNSELGDTSRLSIATFAEDAIALLDHLGIRHAIVGGISLGAALSMRLAARHANRVAGLILARPAWVVGPSATMAPYLEIAALLEEFGADEGALRFEASACLAAVAAVSPDNAVSLKSFFSRPNPASTIALLSTIPRDSPGVDAETIAGIQVPTLIIGTHHDFVHPLAYAERLQQILPHATLRVITAKSVNKDHYKLDFREALSQFLTGMLVSP